MVGCKKRVRFGSDSGCSISTLLVETRSELEDEKLLEILYFSRDDYRVNRAKAKLVAQDLERLGRTDSLKEAFNEKSKTLQDGLNGWTAGDHEGRGVERWACRRHGDLRQVEQFAVIMTVLETQEKLKADPTIKPKDLEKQLGKVASKASRKARHFARMMGKADSHAMAQMIKEEQQQYQKQLLLQQQQQQAATKIQNMAYLMGGRGRQREDDNLSLTSATDSLASNESCHLHQQWMRAGTSSLLLNNSSDEDEVGPGGNGVDEDDLFSSVEDIFDDSHQKTLPPGTGSTPKQHKTKKLRLLKKIKRRMSATGAGTGDSLHKRTSVPLDIDNINSSIPPNASPPRRRASTNTKAAPDVIPLNPMITPRRSSLQHSTIIKSSSRTPERLYQ